MTDASHTFDTSVSLSQSSYVIHYQQIITVMQVISFHKLHESEVLFQHWNSM